MRSKRSWTWSAWHNAWHPERTWQTTGVLLLLLLPLSLFFIIKCNNNDNHFDEFIDSGNIPAVDLHSQQSFPLYLKLWRAFPLVRAQCSFQFKILNNLLTSSSKCRAAPPLTAPTLITGHTCSTSFPTSDQTHDNCLKLPILFPIECPFSLSWL